MNVYLVVEGRITEPTVYTAWLQILAPNMTRIEDAFAVEKNNYYIFNSNGIPSIYRHVVNAICDINKINDSGKNKYDYLLVCLDTEEENREYFENQIKYELKLSGETLRGAELFIFEQKVCMETWFLGNRKMFKANAQDKSLLSYISKYNVRMLDPEEMDNLCPEKFSTKAQFHYDYLKRMLKERSVKYSKSKPDAVCDNNYLNQLIERYLQTNDIKSFGSWYDFVKRHFK